MQLDFDYDKFYKANGLLLKKASSDEEIGKIKQEKQKELANLLRNVEIDIEDVKKNFIDILLDTNASKLLWILYSKYDGKENYIDKIGDIFKKENTVTRGGTNTYKMNGWMTHTLYVYQIVNYNLARNIELSNFNGMPENKKQVDELNNIYISLSNELKFILNIFALIHDIGVVEDIKFHDKSGTKYVEQVMKEMGINQEILNQKNILLNEKDLIQTLKVLIEYHALITSLSAENNDKYVENEYKNLISKLPEIEYIKKEIPKILLLLAYGDVIAVDESLMDEEKYRRICDCYVFFDKITKGEKVNRDKEKVAIERICDIIGESKFLNLKLQFDDILKRNNIEKKQFIEDMYNIKSMKFAAPLMKSLKDTEMTIKIYYKIFRLIEEIDTRNGIEDYTIFFIPDKHENEFVKEFKNGNFFECIDMMKKSSRNECTYGKVKIERKIETDGKYLYIKII